MAYLNYLLTVFSHKWHVLIECHKAGILHRGLLHDLSKFHPAEFGPYVRHHKVSADPSRKSPEYTAAKQRHFQKNPHHWQYWLDEDSNPQPMHHHALLEMVCDWYAAAKSYPGSDSVADYYAQNRGKMQLHPETRATLERLLGICADPCTEACSP